MEVEVQYAYDAGDLELPGPDELRGWARLAMATAEGPTDIVIRIVDTNEGRTLNKNFRNQDQPTNVLSFPFDAPEEVNDTHLGDLVICAPVVCREAGEQHKPVAAHWAHMVVHGVLHLRGYDHQEPADAEVMERLETKLMLELGFADPYDDTTAENP